MFSVCTLLLSRKDLDKRITEMAKGVSTAKVENDELRRQIVQLEEQASAHENVRLELATANRRITELKLLLTVVDYCCR